MHNDYIMNAISGNQTAANLNEVFPTEEWSSGALALEYTNSSRCSNNDSDPGLIKGLFSLFLGDIAEESAEFPQSVVTSAPGYSHVSHEEEEGEEHANDDHDHDTFWEDPCHMEIGRAHV